MTQTIGLCKGCISLSNAEGLLPAEEAVWCSDKNFPLFRLVRAKTRENAYGLCIQVNEMRIDNLFLLEDDLIAIIDYESAVKWENHLKYLIYIVRILERYKKDDFETTVRSLRSVAGSLKLCDNPRLKELGYRRMDFFSHRYFMM